jgi:hypothetical protein
VVFHSPAVPFRDKKAESRLNLFNSASQTRLSSQSLYPDCIRLSKSFLRFFSAGAPPLAPGISGNSKVSNKRWSSTSLPLFLSHKEREKEIIVLGETCKSYFGIFSKSLNFGLFQGFLLETRPVRVPFRELVPARQATASTVAQVERPAESPSISGHPR